MSRSRWRVDLGASSGRVMLGRVGPDTLELTEVHRFPNGPVRLPGGLHWDVLGLYRGRPRRAAARPAAVRCDWPGRRSTPGRVDYGLLDADGALLGNPVHYRDGRTDGCSTGCTASSTRRRLYAATGLQFLPFNTLYQLAAGRRHELAAPAGCC